MTKAGGRGPDAEGPDAGAGFKEVDPEERDKLGGVISCGGTCANSSGWESR